MEITVKLRFGEPIFSDDDIEDEIEPDDASFEIVEALVDHYNLDEENLVGFTFLTNLFILFFENPKRIVTIPFAIERCEDA